MEEEKREIKELPHKQLIMDIGKVTNTGKEERVRPIKPSKKRYNNKHLKMKN